MPPPLRYVVSAQDGGYHSWQAMLAHYSCLTRVGEPMLVIVHDDGPYDPAAFDSITRTSGRVVRAPSYTGLPDGTDYLPRNTAGSLLAAAELVEPDELIVLCDPDFVFLRSPELPAAPAAAAYAYLDYTQAPVLAAAERLGVTLRDIQARGDALHCGAPYVVPGRLAEALARAWLEATDAFVEPRWWDIMHAFGIAVVRLGLPLTRAPLVDCNYWPDDPPVAPIIHYCYDNPGWSKRDYQAESGDPGRVWSAERQAPQGTILGEVLVQLREAGAYYGLLGATPAGPR